MKILNYTILIASLTLGSSFSASAALESTDVEQLDTLWSASFNEGNTVGLMSLYTKDAMVFPPSSEILDNASSIKAYLDGLRNVGFNNYSIAEVDMQVKGDTVYSTSLWEATRIDAAGNEITLDGNITNIIERQEDGSWKIKLQSWN